MLMSASILIDGSFLGAIIGSIITIVIFLITHHLKSKENKMKEKKEIINLIVSNNYSLFALIQKYSLDNIEVDHVSCKKALEEAGGVVYILPKKTKEKINLLFKIYLTEPQYFQENKHKVKCLLKQINDDLSEFGVEAFVEQKDK